MSYELKMRIWRGDQSGGELGDFTVEVSEGEVVLDAIHRVQATQAGDLAVRWNCKAGKCGSCSAEINGRQRLMCMTRLSDFDQSETITVTPLRAYPVIRDLVTDVSINYEKAAELPAFAPPPRDWLPPLPPIPLPRCAPPRRRSGDRLKSASLKRVTRPPRRSGACAITRTTPKAHKRGSRSAFHTGNPCRRRWGSRDISTVDRRTTRTGRLDHQ